MIPAGYTIRVDSYDFTTDREYADGNDIPRYGCTFDIVDSRGRVRRSGNSWSDPQKAIAAYKRHANDNPKLTLGFCAGYAL